MASQCILATPPSQGVILNSLLKNASYYKAWLPRLYVGLRECNLDAEMPLLLNPPGAPLACREPLAEFRALPIMERINPLAPGVCLASPTAEDALPSRRRAVHVVHVAALRGASSRG